MDYAKLLIDRARELGHGDAETARRIGVSRSYLCDVHAGRKRLSPEAAALLAEVIGEDATEALKRQTVANERDPERRGRLSRALFMCWVLGVVASLGATVDAVERVDSLYIAAHVRRWLSAWRGLVLRARSTRGGRCQVCGAVSALAVRLTLQA